MFEWLYQIDIVAVSNKSGKPALVIADVAWWRQLRSCRHVIAAAAAKSQAANKLPCLTRLGAIRAQNRGGQVLDP